MGRGQELEKRIDTWVDQVLEAIGDFPPHFAAAHLKDQLLRAATSVGANYREARGSESVADWIHKLSATIREAREADFWIGRAKTLGLIEAAVAGELLREGDELIAILVASRKTTKLNQKLKKQV